MKEPKAFGLPVGAALFGERGAGFQIKIALSSLTPGVGFKTPDGPSWFFRSMFGSSHKCEDWGMAIPKVEELEQLASHINNGKKYASLQSLNGDLIFDGFLHLSSFWYLAQLGDQSVYPHVTLDYDGYKENGDLAENEIYIRRGESSAHTVDFFYNQVYNLLVVDLIPCVVR